MQPIGPTSNNALHRRFFNYIESHQRFKAASAIQMVLHFVFNINKSGNHCGFLVSFFFNVHSKTQRGQSSGTFAFWCRDVQPLLFWAGFDQQECDRFVWSTRPNGCRWEPQPRLKVIISELGFPLRYKHYQIWTRITSGECFFLCIDWNIENWWNNFVTSWQFVTVGDRSDLAIMKMVSINWQSIILSLSSSVNSKIGNHVTHFWR